MTTLIHALIRLCASLMPVKSIRKRIRRRLMNATRDARMARTLPLVQARYADHVAACRAKLARGEKLSVAFLVCDASMFSGESVFLKLKDDPRFSCSICVAPRVTRGDDFLRETLTKTLESLTVKYGSTVHSLYDPETRTAQPLEVDLVFSTILYEDQTLPDYTTEHLSACALVSVLYYGYGGLFRSNEKKTPFLPNIVFSWRYFVSNEATRQMSLARNALLADCIRTVGYTKMDRLEDEMSKRAKLKSSVLSQSSQPISRKKVILSPHHTIDKESDGLALSTFLLHADLYLQLPAMFPEIDFVFRPHPLLFVRLATSKWWGAEKTAAYKAKLVSFSNVEFQQGGDYLATFADSDALIHDCGSFLAEYFYTGKPQCYLLESPKTIDEQFLPFSRELLNHAYKAFTGEEIVSFIRTVILEGRDPAKAARDAFAAHEVCVNHPHATDAVISSVLQNLL